MSAVWDHSQTTPVTRLVFLALADHCDHEGLGWPAIPQLARKCRMSERSVQRALAEIEDLGEIARTFRKGHSSLYQVLLPGCGKPLTGVTRVSPPVVTNRRQVVTDVTSSGDTVGAQNHQEPSIEPRAREITPVDELPARIAEIRKALKEHPSNGQRDA
jgi:hypothetical protein